MGTIYRRLIFEIDRLREIVKGYMLDTQWDDELVRIKNRIPAYEVKRRKILFSKKAVQPSDMNLFSELRQNYMNVHKYVCDDIDGHIHTLKHKDMEDNKELISFLENLEDKISFPKKYIDFYDIMPSLDFSGQRELLRHYIEVLKSISASVEEQKKSERFIYENLFYWPERVFDFVDQEIERQQRYLKTQNDSLIEIENEYKRKIAEAYGKFINSAVSKKLIEFVNSQIIRPWNQVYGHGIRFNELIKTEEICIPFTYDKEAEIKDRTLPGNLMGNSRWAEHSETYIVRIEDQLKKIFMGYTQDYADKCVWACLERMKEEINLTKRGVIKSGHDIEQKVVELKQLKEELKLQAQEVEEYYSIIKIKPVKTKQYRSVGIGAQGRKLAALFFVVVIAVVVFSIGRRSRNIIPEDAEKIEDTETIRTVETIKAEEPTRAVETTKTEETVRTSEVAMAEETARTAETTEATEAEGTTDVIETTMAVEATEALETSETAAPETSSETQHETEKEQIKLAVDEDETQMDNGGELKEEYAYILPEVSFRYLSREDLSGLDKGMLRLARNEVFARHGRLFKTEDLNTYFSSQPWYHGYLSEEEFDDSVLNQYEKTNLDLIKSVEHDIAVIMEESVLNAAGKIEKGNESYILPESNSRYLSVEDLDGLDLDILRLARNEIFARHGRSFQTEDLNEYFSSQPWYYGYLSMEEFDDSVLNNYEKANLDLIRNYENQKKRPKIEYETFNIDWNERYEQVAKEVSQLYENITTKEDYTNQLKQEYLMWDNLLNEVYGYIRAWYETLPDKSFDSIREEEFAWIRERDERAEYYRNATSEQKEDVYYDSMIRSTKDRTLELIQNYIP